jgi:hypothetical protein
MIRSIDIDKKSKLAFFRFEIMDQNETIIIREMKVPNQYRNTQFSNKDMDVIQLHVENIPALIGSIIRIYQTKDGGVEYIRTNNDKLSIGMNFDDRGNFDCLNISDSSGRNRSALTNEIRFVFEEKFHISDPLPRIPTPAMIWFTDTLKQIHDEWEK